MATNTIFFGTNRQLKKSRGKVSFSNGASTGDDPAAFRVGTIPVTKKGNGWRMPNEAYEAGEPTLFDEKPPTEGRTGKLGSTDLFTEMQETMRKEPRDALVFIHGFDNSFESAMERAAEIRDNYLAPPTEAETGALGSRGREPMVFAFSWPSDGRTFLDDDRGWAYSGDRVAARLAGVAMARCALRLFDHLERQNREEHCEQRIHLVAHSMGNWALRHTVQALREMAQEAGRPLRRVFENVFLMGADIEADALEHEHWLNPLFDLSRRIHVYHADNDRALDLSVIKPNQGSRLGHFGPDRMEVLGPRVTAIDCSDVSYTPADTASHSLGIGALRHQYYRLAPEVIKDVRGVLSGKAADEVPGRTAQGNNRFRLKLDKKAREKLDKG